MWQALTTKLPGYDRRPWTLQAVDLQACVGGLGRCGFHASEFCLAAGQWTNHILLATQDQARKQAALSWRQSSETCPLLEMCCLFHQKTSFANRAQRREQSRRRSRFLFSNLRFITRKSNVQPAFAGTSSPGRPLENGVFWFHAYVKLIGFANLPLWQLRLRFVFSRDESCWVLAMVHLNKWVWHRIF